MKDSAHKNPPGLGPFPVSSYESEERVPVRYDDMGFYDKANYGLMDTLDQEPIGQRNRMTILDTREGVDIRTRDEIELIGFEYPQRFDNV